MIGYDVRTKIMYRFFSFLLTSTNKSYIWSIALYGAETWTLRAADQKYLESFEMWCWRRMEKISWTDHVRNEEVLLKSQRAEEYPTRNKKTEG